MYAGDMSVMMRTDAASGGGSGGDDGGGWNKGTKMMEGKNKRNLPEKISP